MSSGADGGARGTFSAATTFKLEDLPVSSGDPLEVELDDDVCQIAVKFLGDAYYAVTTNDLSGSASFDSAITAGNVAKCSSGDFISIDVAGLKNVSFYARSTGSAVSEGISYILSEDV